MRFLGHELPPFLIFQSNTKTGLLFRGQANARRERDTQLARSELLRGALRNHQDKMLAIIEGILDTIQLPPAELQLELPVSLPGAQVEYNKTKGLVLVLDVEERLEWELLMEHLGKHDPLWGTLEQWKKATIRHIQARKDLKLKVENVVRSKTGYELVDNPNSPPFIYSYTTIPLLYNTVINIALGTPSRTELEELIKIHTDAGEVRYGPGTILAKAPGEEEQTSMNILAAFDELKKSAESKRITQTYKEVEENIPKLKRAAQEIVMLGVIPGRCRVCRRLGI
jgi:hypothetical protein